MLRRVLNFCLLACAVVSLGAHAEWENLSTEAGRKAQLIRLYRENFAAFKALMESSDSPLEVLEKQHEIMEQLKELELLSEIHDGNGRVQIQIHDEVKVGMKTKVINPAALSAWRDGLLETARSLDPAKPYQEELVRAIQEGVAEMGTVRADGWDRGLLMLLPEERRGPVTKMGFEERLKAYTQELPEDLKSAGFEATRFGVAQEHLTRKQAVQILRRARRAQTRLQSLVQLHALAQDSDGKVGAKHEDAVQSIRKLGEAELDVFFEKAELSKRVAHISKELAAAPIPVVVESGTRTYLQNAVVQQVRAVQNDQVEVEVRAEGALKISEEPPWVTIFRGRIGHDCATDYSFPYPNSKYERVFYLYDEDGLPRGYAAGTIVEVAGKKVFYLHTINGPRLNAAHVRQVLVGLGQAKEQLGVTGFVLPNDRKLSENINYVQIQTVFRDLLKNGKSVDIEYLDSQVRDVLDGHASEEYDRASANQKGVAVEFPTASSQTRVHIGIKDTSKEAPSTKLTRVEGYLISRGLGEHGWQAEFASEVLRKSGLVKKQSDEITDLIDNEGDSERPTIAEYEAAVRTRFEKLGANWDEVASKLHTSMQYGRLLARDAFEPQNLERSAEALVELKSEWNPQLIDSHRQQIGTTQAVQGAIARVMNPNRAEDQAELLNFLAFHGLGYERLVDHPVLSEQQKSRIVKSIALFTNPETNPEHVPLFFKGLTLALELKEEKEFIETYTERAGVLDAALRSRSRFSKQLHQTLEHLWDLNKGPRIHDDVTRVLMADATLFQKRVPGLFAKALEHFKVMAESPASLDNWGKYLRLASQPKIQSTHPELAQSLLMRYYGLHPNAENFQWDLSNPGHISALQEAERRLPVFPQALQDEIESLKHQVANLRNKTPDSPEIRGAVDRLNELVRQRTARYEMNNHLRTIFKNQPILFAKLFGPHRALRTKVGTVECVDGKCNTENTDFVHARRLFDVMEKRFAGERLTQDDRLIENLFLEERDPGLLRAYYFYGKKELQRLAVTALKGDTSLEGAQRVLDVMESLPPDRAAEFSASLRRDKKWLGHLRARLPSVGSSDWKHYPWNIEDAEDRALLTRLQVRASDTNSSEHRNVTSLANALRDRDSARYEKLMNTALDCQRVLGEWVRRRRPVKRAGKQDLRSPS